MRIPLPLGFLVLVLLLQACEPPAPPSGGTLEARAAAGPPPPADPWLDDGRPQTGLPKLTLFLGPKQLQAEVAMTTAAIQKGMMWRTNVAETNAMLFVFGRPHQTSFWMKNVPIDIDVAYIDTDGVIAEVHRLERHNTNPVLARRHDILYALETAAGWFQRNGIGPGVAVQTEHGSLRETFSRGRTAQGAPAGSLTR